MIAETAAEAIYSFCLDGGGGRESEKYYVAVPLEYREWLAESLDPALPIGMLRAMESSQSLEIQAEVDSLLVDRVEHEWQRMFSHLLPNLQIVPVEYSGLSVSQPISSELNILAFSGGVDSMFSLNRLIGRLKLSGSPLSHLLHISYQRFELEAEIRLSRLKKAASTLGIPLIPVRTNLDQAFIQPQALNHWLYMNIHETLFISTALAIGRQGATFHFSSTYPVETTNRVNSRLSSSILPILAWAGQTSSVSFQIEGAGYTRSEKLAEISTFGFAQEFLDVCDSTKEGKKVNCSRCVKCIQTLVDLDVNGSILRFESVFDLSQWERKRFWGYLEVLFSGRPIRRELAKSLRKRSAAIPLVPRWIILSRIDTLLKVPHLLFLLTKGQIMRSGRLYRQFRSLRKILVRT